MPESEPDTRWPNDSRKSTKYVRGEIELLLRKAVASIDYVFNRHKSFNLVSLNFLPSGDFAMQPPSVRRRSGNNSFGEPSRSRMTQCKADGNLYSQIAT